MKNTIKNTDTITLVGLTILTMVILPLIVSITYKVLTTSSIIF